MNIKEIAQLAGVSPSTVSKILNQKDESISQETRERVLKTVKEYHYTPYACVSPPQKTWTIGILLSVSPSFDPALNGIIQIAQTNGYSTLVYNSYSDAEQELKNITSLCKNNVDGIIWEPVNKQSLEYASYIQEKNIQFLTVGKNGGDSSLVLPYEEFAYLLTQELIDAGHRNIACILKEGRRVSPFLKGYKRSLFDNQITLDDELIFYEFSDTLLHKINQHEISGIICSHYQKALELYQFINSLQYRIPEDFSLISLKNDFQETLAFPEISTYTVSNTNFGSFLCKKIISQIEKTSNIPDKFSQAFNLDNHSTISSPFYSSSKKITIVGSINTDTYLNVAQLPHSGKTVSTSTSAVYPGGKGINQAIGAARLGQRVTLIGNVGTDLDSDNIYRFLNENSVETCGIKRCRETDTGKAYIFVENSGNSMISILAGANDLFTPEDIRKKRNLFENTGYCLIQSEIPLDTVLEACRIAHEHGAKTILKPSACNSLSLELLSHVDIIVPNEDEIAELLGNCNTSLEQQTEMLLSCGVEIVIVTLGARGCYVKTREWSEYFSAISFPSIDNTGASDAFISAFASYLMMGYSIQNAVRIASYAAGFCISRDGVVPALIDKNSLESYIRQHDPELLQKRPH